MTINDQNLIWIDLEMTGLDPETHKIIEIATVVTDPQLNVLAEGPVLAIYQPEAELLKMDDWCTTTHTNSGLVERIRQSTITEAQAVAQTVAFLEQWVPKGVSPICGNSIGQDRRFLYKHMPVLEQYFHYRYLDVSTLKELTRRWKPELLDGFSKQGSHLALDDIHDSIAELRYYREHIFNI
ncbi:oligoribonuclease [Photobacterium iliopiscarium]|jgi:oligoribonuclease|uniref:Oligoribonuclease n=1 Tax=Photobacterium iliopiscarium TaxID=56192 RepID=A0A0D8PMX7_9GAMM|nr:oligoribonuclease [Photobacterium iliopiscarium]KJG12579.1 oligoribonuclease [Photobacterium iliopiscarium]KJG20296.1 oligoribonuclease [Photobacterium iliopiscarium]MCD9468560.1 oligoribonuclease [Photobacterium iliopiscarium]MCD9487876.1 oligoribonuclease [Photobacterium iliopiscarium]MCF2244588.1 oligoribonuclease [Photobacterium iliopiscarium]